jgi:hypothetical protein
LSKEDIVKEDVEVENLPRVFAETVGADEGDGDGHGSDPHGHEALHLLVTCEDVDDVLEGNHEGEEDIEEEQDYVLVLP